MTQGSECSSNESVMTMHASNGKDKMCARSLLGLAHSMRLCFKGSSRKQVLNAHAYMS